MHFDFSRILQGPYISWLLDGLQVSLLLFGFAWVIAFSLAVVLTLVRLTEIRPLVFLVAAYVEIGRSVPLLIQVFFWYFAASSLLPHAVDRAITRIDPEFIYAGIAFGLGMAAYLSEVLRSGIRSIPHTQIEAGRALGFGWLATMRLVVLPQAFRATVPPLLNYTLMLFKNTSVALAIGVKELTYQTRLIENTTFATFEIFALTTLIYLTGSLLLTVTGELLERHWNRQVSGT
ncbi:MAG: amino acid ABC transporter permease [Rhodobacteraceae bacterium]|nr:amino acid ABC transporter permease [Paracoccaceae bacterium]